MSLLCTLVSPCVKQGAYWCPSLLNYFGCKDDKQEREKGRVWLSYETPVLLDVAVMGQGPAGWP